MTFFLDIDVGNTRLKWRLRKGAETCQRGYAQMDSGLLDELALPWDSISQVNVACVAKPDIVQRLREQVEFRGSARFFVAHTDVSYGRVRNAYQNPQSLGIDRWLAIIAAFARSSGACCVVDCGTAVTIDLVAEDGLHEGGYIIPGLRLQQSALHLGTHAVRSHEAVGSLEPGNSTSACALNGIFASLSRGVDGIVAAWKASHPGCSVFLTGGDAEVIGSAMKTAHGLEPDLVLDGLSLLASSHV